MIVKHFFDTATYTLTYVVHAEGDDVGIVIDPVLDFDSAAGRTTATSCQAVAAYIEEQQLSIPFVVDTHVHADHLSGMDFFKRRFQSTTVIGRHITAVQETFKDIFNLGSAFPVDGSQFDVLLDQGDALEFGSLKLYAHHTPGHTPACMSYQIGDALFVGDTLFMPDYGTARCDFPKGSAETLFDSIQKLYAFDDATRVFVCHDYQPGGRELRFETTIGEQKHNNVQLTSSTEKADYVAFREKRDAKLGMPKLILPSLQINIRAGCLPDPEDNGTVYLKLPLNLF